MSRYVEWYALTDVSKNRDVFSFKVKQSTLLGLLNLEDEGTTILRNVGNYLPVDRAYHPRRLVSSVTPLLEPLISQCFVYLPRYSFHQRCKIQHNRLLRLRVT